MCELPVVSESQHWPTTVIYADGCANLSLRNLQSSPYPSNFDNTGRVDPDISTAFVEQAEKSRRHVIDREGIDVVSECSPHIRSVVVET